MSDSSSDTIRQALVDRSPDRYCCDQVSDISNVKKSRLRLTLSGFYNRRFDILEVTSDISNVCLSLFVAPDLAPEGTRLLEVDYASGYQAECFKRI